MATEGRRAAERQGTSRPNRGPAKTRLTADPKMEPGMAASSCTVHTHAGATEVLQGDYQYGHVIILSIICRV